MDFIKIYSKNMRRNNRPTEHAGATATQIVRIICDTLRWPRHLIHSQSNASHENALHNLIDI